MQFIDDITDSITNTCELAVVHGLTDTFQQTKAFCEKRELIINSKKTQFIIFKAPSRKLQDKLQIILDGHTILPSEHVKLLGVALDRLFTFGHHIDEIV